MGFKQGRRSWRWCVVVLIGMVAMTVSASDSHTEQEQPLVSRIAFGSCSNQSALQPIWDAVVDFRPQIFIWLGDNIYGDIKRPFKLFGRERTIGPWKNAPRFVPSSEQEMEARYRMAKANPGYARVQENTKVIGTWDDHDFGLNDAGKEFHGKIANQKLLLDFLDEPQDSPRRKQAGVYTSYKYGPAGRDVKIILLDTRYHRDPVGSDGTILGNSQWLWLEKELKGLPTAITIIGSSIQVISNLSATIRPLFSMESWGRFPKERDRLFKLIADSKRGGVFFISGDVHFGEITRYDCALDYPLYDVTSSGLTQSIEEPNFGTVEIDWHSHPVTLKLKVRDKNGVAVSGVNISLVELQASNSETWDRVKAGHNQRQCTLEVSLPWIKRYRLAILFFFTLAVLLVAFLGLAYTAITVFRQGVCKRKHD